MSFYNGVLSDCVILNDSVRLKELKIVFEIVFEFDGESDGDGAVSKKPDPGPRTSLRLANLTGPRTSLRLDNWSADQFAFGQLVRRPVCVWLTGPQTSLMIQL